MQIKTINLTIRKKLEEWLNTITDKSLGDKVKENLLLSGGSITSMLLNEDINDYDIYIQDMGVLKNLTNYYVNKITGVEILDGRKKDDYLREVEYVEGINVYGISINNLHRDQIKLFFSDTERGSVKLNQDVAKANKEKKVAAYIPVFLSPNAISLSDKIQIVLRFNGNAKTIHETFDFIHATNYFTFKDGLVTNVEALESIITKQLKYQGSLYPVTTIIRAKKFIKRGWNINAGELFKVMFQISELDLKDPMVLEEQLIGVDVAYFNQLIFELRKIGKGQITSDIINKIIDKVFNESHEDE